MRQTLNRVVEQINQMSRKMTASQRLSIAVLAAVVVVSLVTLLIWSGGGKPGMVVLFQNLPADKASYVKGRLAEWGFEYDDGGGTIKVAPEDKHRIMGKLMGDRVLRGDKNPFEFVFKSSLTGTESQRKMQMVEAVRLTTEGALATWPGIRDAVVIITPADSNRFISQELKEARASVSLTMESGRELTHDEVESISMFLAGAVEKLRPENVQIVAGGKYYSIDKVSEMPLGPRHTRQEAINQTIAAKIKENLQRTYSDVVVTVMVTLNMTKDHEIKRETNASSVTHTRNVSDTVSNSNAALGSPAGANANEDSDSAGDATAKPAPQEGASSYSSRSENERSFDPKGGGSVVEKYGLIKDTIEEINISVLVPYKEAIIGVDGTVPASQTDKDKNLAASISQIEKLIAGCIPARPGNKIFVTAGRFREAEPAVATKTGSAGQVAALAKEHGGTILLGAFALLSLLIITFIVKRSLPTRAVQRDKAAAKAGSPQAPLKDEEILRTSGNGDPERDKSDIYKNRIHRSVREDAEAAADLLKHWLVKEK